MLKSPDELPEGVDLAVFTLPAAGVREAIEACARRKVGSAMIFAAGFAEVGDQALQDAVTATARAAALAVVGPNCLGFTNNVDGLMLHMLYAREAQRRRRRRARHCRPERRAARPPPARRRRLRRAAQLRDLDRQRGRPRRHRLPRVPRRRSRRRGDLVLYSEEIRRPRDFLAAIRRCRAAGKPVVLMFPGRSAKARKSAQSHTGSLIGDYATMRTQVEDAGAIVVTTMDEMMDLAEILVRYPVPPVKGPGILTASGAYVGLTNDFAEDLGLDFPELDPATLRKLEEVLPPFGNYGNPLDVTAGFAPEALAVAAKALIDDPNIGMLFISFPISLPPRWSTSTRAWRARPSPR